MLQIRSFGCRDGCCEPSNLRHKPGLELLDLDPSLDPSLRAVGEGPKRVKAPRAFSSPFLSPCTHEAQGAWSARTSPSSKDTKCAASSPSKSTSDCTGGISFSRCSSCTDLSVDEEVERETVAADPFQPESSCAASGCTCGAGYSLKEDLLVHRVVRWMGLQRLAEAMGSSLIVLTVSILCFIVAVIMSRHMGQCACRPARKVHLALLGVTFFLSGFPQFLQAMCRASARSIDVHVLLVAAALGTLAMGMPIEGALLLLLFHISHVLEVQFTMKAHGNLEHLLDGIPTMVTQVALAENGGPALSTVTTCRATDVLPGQLALVKAGEQVPLDGIIVWGTASVSMQHISGEVTPNRLDPGCPVPAGSLNTDGLLVVKVTASADSSTPAQMVKMAQAAKATKPHIQRLLDQVGTLWSKMVIIATLSTVLVLPLLGVPLLGPDGALYRALAVLTAGSPCAVFLAPLAYVCAISTITRKGVLAKSAGCLDSLSSCTKVALDKTGTITSGKLALTDAATLSLEKLIHDQEEGDGPVTSVPWRELSEAGDLLHKSSTTRQYAIALSRTSNHPVSQAVLDAFGETRASVECLVSEVEQVPGSGVAGKCKLGELAEVQVRLGSLAYVLQVLPALGSLKETVEREVRQYMSLHKSPKAVCYMVAAPVGGPEAGAVNASELASDPALTVAVFCFEDSVQPGVREFVASLRQGSWRMDGGRLRAKDRKEVVMLTGDNIHTARHVSQLAGITYCLAGMKPQDKIEFVQKIRAGIMDERLTSMGNLGPVAGEAATRGANEKLQSWMEADGGLLMMGDGINDAPALAGAHVGVAVAESLNTLVTSAADIIVLNGRGVANLPWLFCLADRLQTVVKQNIALAVLSMLFAVVPAIAGIFPLWLAVLLHEGSTVLVALNSLRLLQDPEVSMWAAISKLHASVVADWRQVSQLKEKRD